MCHSDKILAGHSLKGGTQAGHFQTLGETASMHACLQRCCSRHPCDVALLIDGRCYGVACFSKELCEAIPVPHPHFVFSQLGFITKGQKRGDIEKNQGMRPTLAQQNNNKKISNFIEVSKYLFSFSWLAQLVFKPRHILCVMFAGKSRYTFQYLFQCFNVVLWAPSIVEI